MDHTAALSAEVLDLVLSHLHPRDVLRARAACRRWRAAAETVIAHRAAHDGPFLLLVPESLVPEDCTLPLFETLHLRQISHPAVARCTLFGWEHVKPLLSRPALRKLQRVTVTSEWPAALLRSDVLQRVRHLDVGVGLPAPVEPRCLARVTSIQLSVAANDALARATPNCTTLQLTRAGSLDVHACAALWPALESLSVHEGQVCILRVPRHLTSLHLLQCKNYDNPAPCERAPVLDFPRLRKLEIDATSGLSVRVRAPNLRTLEMRAQELALLDIAASTQLTEVRLSKLTANATELGCLGPSMRRLSLYAVCVPNLDFLQATVHLQELSLTSVQAAACSLPCAHLARLRELCVDGSLMEITNWRDFGALCSLDALWLTKVAYVTELAWVAGLQRLTWLTCEAMSNLVSLRGLADAASLEKLVLEANWRLRDVACIAACPRLRSVRLELMNVDALDLSTSPVKWVKMSRVVCGRTPVLPVGLRSVTLNYCSFPEPAQQCLAGLHLLRHVDIVPVVDAPAFKTLIAQNPLRHAEATLVALPCGPSDHISLESMELVLDDASSLAPGSLRVASLTLDVRQNISNLAFVDTSVLRSLALSLPFAGTGEAPSLAPLRACTHLWFLSLNGGRNISTLDELRGHPALREVHMLGYSQNLDVGALLTCPRLAVANLNNVNLDQAQRHALMLHTLAVRALDAL